LSLSNNRAGPAASGKCSADDSGRETPVAPAAPDSLRASLVSITGDADRVSVGTSTRNLYSGDLSYHEPHLPDVVVWATCEADVVAVLRYANEHAIPVVPYGAGTSTDGHVIPVHGGIVLDLSRMDSLVAFHPEDQVISVQAGMLRTAVNHHAGPHGLFFPVDPGADATIGGMTGTNASGTTAVRYGDMRKQILGLKVALPDGSLLHTGGRTVKSSAGYDLGHLFIGAEGTLGVVVEITLKLHPIPEHVIAARVAFANVESACAAASVIASVGASTTRVELLDAESLRAFNDFSGMRLSEVPSLFLEFAASRAAVAEDVEFAHAAAKEHGCISFETEADNTARARLWRARHELALAVANLHPGEGTIMSTDVCVPISEMPGAVAAARETAERLGIDAAIFGHVGDGNFHALYVFDRDVPEDVEKFVAFENELVARALERGGTCTGEHGVGMGKIDHFVAEHGDLVPIMRQIKRMVDPVGILNPGKLLPV
jgi:D-lactate dehydrogenase (cytochrome)